MPQEIQNQADSTGCQELLDLPVNTDVMFTNHKNVYKKAVEKRQCKMLSRISFIKPFLRDGEEIIYVAAGCSPVSFFEQFLTGWIIYYLKRCLFVFTNERVFHIPTKYDFSYRNSISRIFYADCRSMAVKGNGLVVEYKNGKKDKFVCIPSGDRKKLKTLLPQISFDGLQSEAAGRTHLCPACASPLTAGQYSCPACSLEFKTLEQARKIAIIYPGGGYFYTGHPLMGIGDALTEFYLTALVIIAAIGVINGAAESVSLLVFIGLLLTLEKAISVFHSTHFVEEFIPRYRDFKVLTGEPEPQPQTEFTAERKPEDVLSASWNSR